MRELVGITLAERSSVQRGEIHGTVPGEWIRPVRPPALRRPVTDRRQMMEDLSGRVAVVTGGAGGIGRAMGERFALEGMKVVLADVEDDALADAVGKLRPRGSRSSG